MEKGVSVIIPTYKREVDFLKQAIESVKAQTYKTIEIIIVDDNGGENNAFSNPIKDLSTIYDNVIYLKHKENQGACAARNTGITKAKYDFIAFLDDDDTWMSNKIEKQIALFSNNEVGLVYCGIKYYIEDKKKYIEKEAVIYNDPCRQLLIKNFIGSTSGGMVRKSSALAVGLFDTNLKSGQDLDFWYRIAKHYKIAKVEECLIKYTIYSSGTITKNYKNRLASNIYLYNKYSDEIHGDKELETVYSLKIAKAYLQNKNYRELIKYTFSRYIEKKISIQYALKYIK